MADSSFNTPSSPEAPAPNRNSLLDVTKANATAAYNSATNGPVAQNVMEQSQKTTTEFNNLAAARKTPETPAATGQPLTHYHSFFVELLSWKHPRASAIAYAAIVTAILAGRYMDVMRWAFKLTWMVVGVTIAAELTGKMVLNNGLASQVRPRKYYVLPREFLDSTIGDVHELINFFVIEAQRIVFVENIYPSILTAVVAFISYYLVKIVPYWGLALIVTTAAFFVPLVYIANREMIDNTLQQASEVVNTQTAQLRDVANKHTAQATTITKQYMGDYTAKAQQILRGHSASPEPSPTKPDPTTYTPTKVAPIYESDFPVVPTQEPMVTSGLVKDDSFQPALVSTPTKPEDSLLLS